MAMACASCVGSCQFLYPAKPHIGQVVVSSADGPLDGCRRFANIPTYSYFHLERGQIEIMAYLRDDSSRPTAIPDPDSNPNARVVSRVASVAAAVIEREFQLGFRPGFVIAMVHTRTDERLEIRGKTILANGLFLGFPMPEGKLADKSLSFLTSGLAHEYSETLLAYADVLDCKIYHGSPRNRWAGEGIADLVTALCQNELRAQDISIGGWYLQYPFGVANPFEGTVSLATWTLPVPGLEGRFDAWDDDDERRRQRYLASEYVVWLWYQGALSNGHEFPIAEFARWAASFYPGPDYEEVVDWMESTSGVALEDLLKAVPMEDVLEYHKTKFDLLPLRGIH